VSDNRYVANVLHLFLISSSITGTKVVNNAHLWGDFRFSAHSFFADEALISSHDRPCFLSW